MNVSDNLLETFPQVLLLHSLFCGCHQLSYQSNVMSISQIESYVRKLLINDVIVSLFYLKDAFFLEKEHANGTS